LSDLAAASADLVVALDADDTLWHNEPLFQRAQQRFGEILASYPTKSWTTDDLYEREKHNLQFFGYGSKGFALSLIETAIQLTEGEIVGRDVQAIIDLAKEILQTPVRLLDGVGEVIPRLAARHRLMLVTKGDLLEQEAKIARSGLASHFSFVEIVSEKDSDTYRRLFARYGLDPRRVVMVGNSLRSDVLPIVALGGHAVHIPYETTWAHEVVGAAEVAGRAYHELASIAELPDFVARLAARADRWR
jgi:putative hydrolase of the HAD superfamily